jgi:ribosomal protein S18 acetylase RimI-like enzyme
VIRRASPSDEPRVDRLVRKYFPNSPYAYAVNIRYPDEYINVVAESREAGIVGFASMLIDPTPHLGSEEWRKYCLYVGVIAVDAECRRQRIGTMMLDLLEREAQARAPQHDWAHLHVYQDNEPALKCFEAFGFEQASEYVSVKDGRRSWLLRKHIHQLPR